MAESHCTFDRFAWALADPAAYGEEIERFLVAVIASSASRRRVLRKGKRLCRSQRGYVLRAQDANEIEVPDAFLPERMKPLRHRASAGRANRENVPCLYLSDDPDTAMAESRPWIGAYVTLTHFEVMKDCKLIDCSLDTLTSLDLAFRDADATAEELEQATWGDIGKAFSMPLTRDDTLEEYLASQVLCERFRQEGYDGVAYKSAMGKGKNVALFDLDAANPINGTLFKTAAVSYKFDQDNNTYYIPKYYPDWARANGIDSDSPAAEQPRFLHIVFDTPNEEIGRQQAPSTKESTD